MPFSQLTVLAPSDLVSQKAAVVECTCADGPDATRSTTKQLTCRVSNIPFFAGEMQSSSSVPLRCARACARACLKVYKIALAHNVSWWRLNVLS